MSFFNSVKNLFKKPNRAVSAQYDAAKTTGENAAYWAMANAWSADRENDYNTRKTLRQRCRYEVGNNPWLNGMVKTQAREIIGNGAKLQMIAKNISEDLAGRVEAAFDAWCKKLNLAETLRLCRMAEARDGEAFLIVAQNFNGKLTVRLIDCDRVTDYSAPYAVNNADGVMLSEDWEPVSYVVLNAHPGDTLGSRITNDYTVIPAQFVIHLFDKQRPEQHRGVPALTAAMPYCSLLRQFTLATVRKMEISANISGFVKTDCLPETASAEDASRYLSPGTSFELPRGSIVSLPAGYDLNTFEINSPNGTQIDFSNNIKCEVGRLLGLPRNLALGDSSSYNYSSGRLDFQEFDRFLKVERARYERDCLDRLFDFWITEFQVENKITIPTENLAHTWYWQGRAHVDPTKEANAAQIRLETGLSTLAEELGAEGKDWRVSVMQKLDEEKFIRDERKKRGLPETSEEKKEDNNTEIEE